MSALIAVCIPLSFTWETFMMNFDKSTDLLSKKWANEAPKSNTGVLDEINKNVITIFISVIDSFLLTIYGTNSTVCIYIN